MICWNAAELAADAAFPAGDRFLASAGKTARQLVPYGHLKHAYWHYKDTLLSADETPLPRPDPVDAVLQLGDPERLQRMGAAGRTWCERHFDWDILVQKAQGIFKELSGPSHVGVP